MLITLDNILCMDVKALDTDLTGPNVTFTSSILRRDEKQKLLIQHVLGFGSTPTPVEAKEIQRLKLEDEEGWTQ